MIKCFEDFVNETYLEDPADVEVLDYDHKKMKKNGYIEATVVEPVEGADKGDKVFVTATEFGQLDDESLISCITSDDETVLIQKHNLQVDIKDKK